MFLVYTNGTMREIATNEGHAHILNREGFVVAGEFATLDEAMGVATTAEPAKTTRKKAGTTVQVDPAAPAE